MPDELIAAPSPEPSPAPASPASQTGTASLMSEMDTLMGPPTEAPKPEAKKPEAAKPEAKPVPPKDESGKFVAKVEPVKEKDPVLLRKRLAEVESDLNKTRSTMAELEKRAALSGEQQRRLERLEQIEKDLISERDSKKQLEAHLYARSYADSPEYQEKYQKRWQARYAAAVRELGGLQVKTIDPDTGDEKIRPATQADFERVRGLHGSRVAQTHEAKKLFGEDYNIVMDDCRELDAIEQQAQEEIASRRSKFDQDMAQHGEQSQRFAQTVQESASQTESQLREKYPEWFGKSDDPDLETATQKGFEYVDSTTSQAEQLSPESRGQRLALIRMWAASFPRNVAAIQKLKSELDIERAKVAKLQGSDPGEGGAAGEGEKKPDGVVGTASLVKDF